MFFINEGNDRNYIFDFFMCFLPLVLLGCEENDLSKGNHLAEDEPDVNHLNVRCGGQALHLAHEDGGHQKHSGQVHAQGRLKEERLEEGGGEGDGYEKQGGEEGGHQLCRNLPLHHNHHLYSFSIGLKVKSPVGDSEDWHVHLLPHLHLVGNQPHCCLVQIPHVHVNGTRLTRKRYQREKQE